MRQFSNNIHANLHTRRVGKKYIAQDFRHDIFSKVKEARVKFNVENPNISHNIKSIHSLPLYWVGSINKISVNIEHLYT